MALQTSDYYKEIAEKFIDKYVVAFGHLDINQMLFLEETEKKPKKYADVRKVGHPYSSLMNYKFILTFYTKAVEGMSEAQQNILVLHELMHIDENFEKLKNHDIQDFKFLISKFGVNWDTENSVEDPLGENFDELDFNEGE